jgi:hypothetical protein
MIKPAQAGFFVSAVGHCAALLSVNPQHDARGIGTTTTTRRRTVEEKFPARSC